jgi:2-polyprenyl-3-methyl-5-hydroxy-6-metoxy-1,4-benzoquinol methylase
MSFTDFSHEYYRHTRKEMLPFVPTDAARILEIGCAHGNFAAILKQRNQAEAWGIELDPRIASEAVDKLDRVLIGSIEANLSSLPVNYFDCIVCNDVLEHLTDPEATLRSLLQLMAPGAVLVGSIPNVRYFHVLFDLVWNADWQYTDYGVLDRTHQRFFTGKSLARTLRSCGYHPHQISGINPTPSIKAKLASALTLGMLNDCRYLQYAFVATANQA